MNSLQILSILSLDKVKELKNILTPDYYYFLSYETSDNFVYNSKYIFEDKYRLIDHLINIIDKKQLHSCETCFIERKNWTKEEVREHILAFNHYTIDDFTYNVETMNIVKEKLS